MQAILAGAASGLLAAIAVDLDAWKKWQKEHPAEPYAFDFRLALKRWAYGAASGAAVAIGWDIRFGG